MVVVGGLFQYVKDTEDQAKLIDSFILCSREVTPVAGGSDCPSAVLLLCLHIDLPLGSRNGDALKPAVL